MSEPKRRHPALTLWLFYMFVACLVFGIVSFLWAGRMKESQPDVPLWMFQARGALFLFNVVCAMALLAWQKWGFWCYCASTAATICLNFLIGPPSSSALGGLVGVLILYVVLQLGGEKSGWRQMG